MRFIKDKVLETASRNPNTPFVQETVNPQTGSIVKRGNNRYYFSDYGKYVGLFANLTSDQLLDLSKGYFTDEAKELLKEFDLTQLYSRAEGNRNYDRFDGDYIINIHQKNEIVNELPYGAFYLKAADGEVYFEDYSSKMNEVKLVKNKTLVQEVLAFFADKRDSGRKKKKGFLLYGKPGNGKSSEIMQLFDIAKENKFRILIVSRRVDFEWLHNLKNLLEGDNTIFVLEEITQRTDADGTEELLTFLDGEYSWNNSITIATTNYPETLPANLVDRPGRFDTFVEYGPPNKEDIKNLGALWGFDPEASLVLSGKDLSFDYVSFIMSQAKAAGITVADALDIETKKKRLISSTFKAKMGMGL